MHFNNPVANIILRCGDLLFPRSTLWLAVASGASFSSRRRHATGAYAVANPSGSSFLRLG